MRRQQPSNQCGTDSSNAGWVTLIPQYLLFNRLGWLDTFLPLIVPYWFGGNAFSIFLMRQFFMTIPRELDDAARIDGAHFLRIFWSILLPLSGPILATLAVIGFINHWNDFLGPLLFLADQRLYPLSFGTFALAVFSGNEPMLTAASALLLALPPLVCFLLLQRYTMRLSLSPVAKG